MLQGEFYYDYFLCFLSLLLRMFTSLVSILESACSVVFGDIRIDTFR